jgi:hypothetical protein
MDVLDALRLTISALRREKARFALVGGLAVSVRSEPRFTRDADLAIATATDQEAEQLVRNLLLSGFRHSASLEQEVTGRLATVRLLAPSAGDDGIVVDLLFASSGIEPEVVAAATEERLAIGLTIPVAATADLIAMKILSERESRFQDGADLIALLREVDEGGMRRVRTLLALMTERGAARGKDLDATLERYLSLSRDESR